MDDDDDVIVAPEFYRPARALFRVYREVFMLEDGCAAHQGAQLLDLIFFHFTSFSLPDFSDWQRPGREDGSAQGRGSQCADLLGKLAAKPPLRAHQRKRHAFPPKG
ncbi:hypothetical protein [Agrobacterium vitis]|uniref:hypothetical protein n=1 Tax=Agrobacterium vitis TaxID=373 RepID=UPI001F1E2B02|nr:hypothetical protein [Agrobacterium vitis]